MHTIIRLTLISIKMFLRNRQAVFFTLFMPIIIMTILGLLSFDRVAKVDVGVAVTAPPTAGTKQFLEQLKGIPALDVSLGTEPQEREAIEKGDRSLVLIVPGDLFPENGFQGGAKSITALANANDPQQSSTALSIIGQFLDKSTLAITNAPTLFELKKEEVSARNLKYIDFLVPGIVAMSIMQMCVFSVAFVFVDYKEKGVLKRLLATPLKPFEFVSANVITRLLVAVVQSAILIGVGVFIFKAHVFGSLFLVALIVILGAIMFLGLGFTISGMAKTVEAVPAIANLVAFPMLFLGGTFFPRESMPTWLQHVAGYLPLTYLSESIRAVMIEGAGFMDVKRDLIWMVIWAVILVVTANISFGFEEKRQ